MNESPTPALDRVTFQQVWRRVMPEDRPDCPFTLEAPALPTVTAAPVPAAPAPPVFSRMAPQPQGQSCLGEASAGDLPFLREALAAAAEGQRAYRVMARQSRRGSLFASLAAAKAGQGKRLSAAFFLIAGKDSPPPAAGTGSGAGSLALAVRARYHAEQEQALRLEGMARATGDPCLAELYRALAGEDRVLAGRLRSWLEEA